MMKTCKRRILINPMVSILIIVMMIEMNEDGKEKRRQSESVAEIVTATMKEIGKRMKDEEREMKTDMEGSAKDKEAAEGLLPLMTEMILLVISREALELLLMGDTSWSKMLVLEHLGALYRLLI